jgi:hypothetical protein
MAYQPRHLAPGRWSGARRRRLVGAAATTLATTVAASGVVGTAYALWTTGGTGSITAAASTSQDLTASPATVSGALLHPGGTADAAVTVQNPNPYAVTITSVTGGTVTRARGRCSPSRSRSSARAADVRARLLVVVTGAALAAAVGPPAVASWAARGAGTTTAGAAALLAATGVAATPVAPTATAVDVTFTAGDQPTGTAFVVQRSTGGTGAVTLACTASPCHDTGLTSGVTYTYTVRPALAAWAGPSVAATATTTAALDVTGATVLGSGKTRLLGTTGTAGLAVDVALCQGTVAACGPATAGYLETVSVTPAAVGAWTTTPTVAKLVTGTAYTAQAVQGPAVSAPFSFTA